MFLLLCMCPDIFPCDHFLSTDVLYYVGTGCLVAEICCNFLYFHLIISLGAPTPKPKKKEGENMSDKKVHNALKSIEDVALAYTAKTSTADTVEEFFNDYAENLEKLNNIKNQSSEWKF